MTASHAPEPIRVALVKWPERGATTSEVVERMTDRFGSPFSVIAAN
jgi:hypothetical protein